jgi:hypothetical protein
MKNALIKFYLDYINDWLTVEAYAIYNQLSSDATLELLSIGRQLLIDNVELSYEN